MKKLVRLTVLAGLMTMGWASQAQAIVSLQIIACQGASCATSAVTVTSGDLNTVVVGDFRVEGSGATVESGGQSNAQQTTINVTRLTTGSATPLDVYVVASGYVLPNPPGSIIETHAATYVNDGAPIAPGTAVPVSFQGWYAPTPLALPVPTAPVAIPGTATSGGLITCTPTGDLTGQCSVGGVLVPIVGGTIPFSLITQTRFNIGTATANLNDTYGTTSQITVFPGTVIPEPASMMLLGTGLLGVAQAVRRRRRAR